MITKTKIKTKKIITPLIKTNKKPKIAIVTWFHCLRNIKLAIGAYYNGYKLELITKREGYALGCELMADHIYDRNFMWDTPQQLEYALETSDADIFWCHNEPDLMTEFAIEVAKKKGKMVIHDIHDLPTLHPENKGQYDEQEKAAVNGSTWSFVPTQDYIEIIKKKYGKTNVLQVNSCLPDMYFPDIDLPRVNGMLYCGQVNVPAMKSNLHYRDLLPLFYEMSHMGIATHIYHTHPNQDLLPYTVAGACVLGTMRMFAAVAQYTRYDYGFVGSSVDCPEIQICMPNKLFDCIAAGIPLVALNAETAGKFILENNLGVSVQGLENMKSVPWGDVSYWEKCRANVRKIRHEFTAEKEVRRAFDKIGI